MPPGTLCFLCNAKEGMTQAAGGNPDPWSTFIGGVMLGRVIGRLPSNQLFMVLHQMCDTHGAEMKATALNALQRGDASKDPGFALLREHLVSVSQE